MPFHFNFLEWEEAMAGKVVPFVSFLLSSFLVCSSWLCLTLNCCGWLVSFLLSLPSLPSSSPFLFSCLSLLSFVSFSPLKKRVTQFGDDWPKKGNLFLFLSLFFLLLFLFFVSCLISSVFFQKRRTGKQAGRPKHCRKKS